MSYGRRESTVLIHVGTFGGLLDRVRQSKKMITVHMYNYLWKKKNSQGTSSLASSEKELNYLYRRDSDRGDLIRRKAPVSSLSASPRAFRVPINFYESFDSFVACYHWQLFIKVSSTSLIYLSGVVFIVLPVVYIVIRIYKTLGSIKKQ